MAKALRVVGAEPEKHNESACREELLARSKQALEEATERVEAWKARIASLYAKSTDTEGRDGLYGELVGAPFVLKI
jgi:hypothetical protein